MEPDEFWEIVERTSRADGLDQLESLREELDRLPWYEVVAFQTRFLEATRGAQTYDLFAAANLINGPCSTEGFRDFRVWLVGRGRRVYEAAVANPDSLADVLDGDAVDGFGLAGVAVRAYETKTGMSDFLQRVEGVQQELPGAPPVPPVPAGTNWDFNDPAALRERLPGLCDLYLIPPEEAR